MSVQALHKQARVSVDSARRDAAHFIDGVFTQGSTGKGWDNRSPLDNSLIGRVPEGGKAEVDAAVQAAKAALDGPWGRMTVASAPTCWARWPTRSTPASTNSWRPNASTPASRSAWPRISTFRAARPISRCSPTR